MIPHASVAQVKISYGTTGTDGTDGILVSLNCCSCGAFKSLLMISSTGIHFFTACSYSKLGLRPVNNTIIYLQLKTIGGTYSVNTK